MVDQEVVNWFPFWKIFVHIDISVFKKQLKIVSYAAQWKKMEVKILLICVRVAEDSVSLLELGPSNPMETTD